MSGNSIFLTSTLVEDPGKIVNKTTRISHFFEYEAKDFEMIVNIN